MLAGLSSSNTSEMHVTNAALHVPDGRRGIVHLDPNICQAEIQIYTRNLDCEEFCTDHTDSPYSKV